jgi:hypothetical protein
LTATTSFVRRKLTAYTLPLQLQPVNILGAEALLDFGSAGTLDIGALCYSQRAPRNAHGSKCRSVDLSSFDANRELNIRNLIYKISEISEKGSQRATSIIVEVSYFINFIDWSDAQGFPDVLSKQLDAKQALKSYILNLHERNRQGKIKLNTALHYQNSALKFLMVHHETEVLHEGIRLLRNNQRSEPTTPPDKNSQAKILSVCTALFDGLCELVLEHKTYPFKLKMPESLNWPQPFLWIFPTTRWMLPPHQHHSRERLPNGHWAYNYVDGTLARPEDIAFRYKTSKSQQFYVALSSVDQARTRIAHANSNRHDRYRQYAARVAHNIFVLLFVANTGMNWAQVRALPWEDKHSVAPAMQGFRSVKFRANNKPVSFEIGQIFLKKFRKFVELRNYLLNGKSHENLFIGFDANLAEEACFQKVGEGVLDRVFRLLKKIDPSISPILTRQWRAAKSDHLLQKHDVSTTALVLQNTEATIERSYAAGSESIAIEEMSSFFNRISAVVIEKKLEDSNTRSPVGACRSFGSPSPADGGAHVEPDCRRLQGCLFCNEYRIHADEIDVRKILSWKYFMQRTVHLTDSVEQFDMLFNETFERIDQLMDEICARGHSALVERVLHEVETQGELDPYWAAKLDMMLSLEII